MHDPGQKIEILSTLSLFCGKIGHVIYFCDITDGKKNRKIRIFPKALVHDVAQRLERFQIVIRARRHFKCCLFTSVAW